MALPYNTLLFQIAILKHVKFSTWGIHKMILHSCLVHSDMFIVCDRHNTDGRYCYTLDCYSVTWNIS